MLQGNGFGSLANIISGMQYVLNLKTSGINVVAINESFGGKHISELEQSTVTSLFNNNIMPVVGAGNDNYYVEETGPANAERALTISALSENTIYQNFPYFADYSNYGSFIDLCLPGTNILSCVPNESAYPNIYTSNTGGKYPIVSGTSMATPHASALIALYATHYGNEYQVATVENKIKESTYDFGNSGWDSLYGYGIPSMSLSIDEYEVDTLPTLNYGAIDSTYNFENELNVSITNNNDTYPNYSYKIHYTLDGSFPTLLNFQEYTSSILIDESSLLRFTIYLFDENGKVCGESDFFEITYFKGSSVCNDDGTGFTISTSGELTSYSSGIKDIIVPEYINGIRVTRLASNLFFGLNINTFSCNQNLSIGHYPFVNCIHFVL